MLGQGPPSPNLLLLIRASLVIKQINLFTEQKTPVEERNKILKELQLGYEVSSYLALVSTALENYPFLSEFPKEDDKPDIIEAKKLFIRFGLVGLTSHYGKCPDLLRAKLQKLPYCNKVLDLTSKILSKDNSAKIQDIVQDMEKYASDETPNIGGQLKM